MATYYSSPNSQSYSREHIPTSYQDSNMMMYMASDSYADAAAMAANSQQQSLEMPPPPPPPPIGAVSDPSKMGGGFGDPGIVQGLSLSLGTRIPSMSGFSSFMGPIGFGDQDSAKLDLSSSSSSPHYGVAARTVPSSKYLRAAQQLLDEVVNVRKALSQHEGRENKSKSGGGDDGSKSESTIGGGDSSTGNSQAPAPPPEISHTEKQELQNKLTKLLSMLDEVDRRYRQYYQQMQIVVSSFDAIAGVGSAKPYTALALQTISRHFRCLRDAITAQIKATRKGLGEDDSGGKGVGISRLRFVDQQLRQQRALHQLGMMQHHAWRPQRGLPESSVSVLRAWLFEHFLHPYPKDSDKIMLARQTGLTRSQVSNWFINARVRLWKPMVEEMYKEETGEADMDSSNSSSENAQRAAAGKPTVTADEERAANADSQHHHHHTHQQQRSSSPFAGSPKPVPPDVEMARGLDGPDYGGLMTMMKPRNGNNGSLYPDVAFHQGNSGGGEERFMAAYHHHQMGGRFGGNGGSGVSLTLGLQHCDGGGGPGMSMSMPMPGGPHHGFVVPMRGHGGNGGDMYDDDGGDEGTDFEQQRFSAGSSNSHLLHDFVM